MEEIWITKANGEKAIYKKEKLINSLKRSGASPELAISIASEIGKLVKNGMSTKEIYQHAFSRLKNRSKVSASKYRLKQAIMELGDTGYPFERFVASLLAAEGFTVQVGTIVNGKCVTHEIDVIAQDEHNHYLCECKFHNQQNRHCSVKTPLYIQSRFKDVEQVWQTLEGHSFKFHKGWIFTNTRFSLDAITYGECSGLNLISWAHPNNNGLKDRIDRTGVHPITCLTSLSDNEKTRLIDLDIVTCIDLCNSPEILGRINIYADKALEILSEAKEVCTVKNQRA